MAPQHDHQRQMPAHIAQVLSTHVHHAALLSSSCHDVVVLAFFRLYRLHRIFLVQSSFFSSLLLGGFSEGTRYIKPAAIPNRRQRHRGAQLSEDEDEDENVLELTFDDPNITRPAFEYCIALLYGANPQLVLPTWSLPTPACPLSQEWPPPSSNISQTKQFTSSEDLPVNSQMPATPRFLVSLLATSIYLGIPSLTNSALTLILASFTPYTVATYLRFALGQPIVGSAAARERIGAEQGNSESPLWWDWELEGPCWGFQSIGVPEPTRAWCSRKRTNDIVSSDMEYFREQTERITLDSTSDGEDEPTRSTSIRSSNKGGEFRSVSPVAWSKQRQDDPRIARPSFSADQNMQDAIFGASIGHKATDAMSEEPILDYGVVSHRIGEACLCYLSRWGGELASQEFTLWTIEKDRLADWLDKSHIPATSDSKVLVCSAIAPFLLPRGLVPSKLEQGAATAIINSRDGTAQFKSPMTMWDIPTLPLCIFSHPSLSHRAVSRNFLFNLVDAELADPTSDDEEDFGASSVLNRCPNGVLDGDVLDTGSYSSLGLCSSHLVELLSSDAFFTHSELERFEVSKSIVQMRRSQRLFAQNVSATVEAAELKAQRTTEVSFVGSERNEHPGMVRIKKKLGELPLSPIGEGTFGRRLDSVQFLRRPVLCDADTSMELDSFNSLDDDDVEELDQDDEQYLRLFREGIYYSHMSFSDLKNISHQAELLSQEEEAILREDEVSSDQGNEKSFAPSLQNSHLTPLVRRRSWHQKATRRTPVPGGARIFAPLDILQAALWAGNELKNQILSHAAGNQEAILSGALPASTKVNPNIIWRGLAFAAEGSPLASDVREESVPQSVFMASSSSNGSSTADESTLRITSSLKQFAVAAHHAGSGVQRRAGMRSTKGLRLGTSNFSPSKTESLQPISLGGLACSALGSSGGSGAAKGLLSKRYFSVPVDDTVRFGEFFAGLLNGSNWSSGNAPLPSSGSSDSAAVQLLSQHAREATGLAIRRDPWALPPTQPGNEKSSKGQKNVLSCLENVKPLVTQLENVLLGGPFADTKRSRNNLFGLRNKACKGVILTRVGEEVGRRKAMLDPSSIERDVSTRLAPGTATSGIAAETSCILTGSESFELQASEEERRGQPEEEHTPGNRATRTGGADGGLSLSENESDLDCALVLAKLENRCWTGYEPMRIGVDFYGLDLLEEKQRLYSPSFFYAGSVWNLYVQTVKKPKGTQLGVYLHRQSPYEPLPPASAHPDAVAYFHTTSAGDGTSLMRGVEAGALTDRNGRLLPRTERANVSPVTPGMSASSSSFLHTSTGGTGHAPHASSRGSSGAGSLTIAGGSSAGLHAAMAGPPVLPGVSPPIPYRDPRKVVRAYFSIHCYSPLGSSLTRFDSGPDKFSESQSWGWKSSSLMGLWELDGGTLEGGRSESGQGFRCVLTLGVV